MANKPISMSKVRQVLKLHSQGVGKKKIALRLGVSKNTVRHYLQTFLKLKTTVTELLKLSDFDLNKMFRPEQEVVLNDKLSLLYNFYPEMEKNLRKRGMTIALQFREFKARHPDSYGSTSFYHYYNLWKRKITPSMHMEHKEGDKMYVDFAGATLPYVDTDTGEIKQAQVFVAILGWSQYTYVEAVPSQSIEDFIGACENALRYFKGVPLAIVPDNLKSAVFKASKYEPDLNENFRAFADHYGTAVLPARSRKPKDKSHVENMVKITYQRIYTHIPENTILLLSSLNSEIQCNLIKLNDAILTGKEYSRSDQWLLEIPSLQPLPEAYYEMRKIKQATVMKNGHIYLTEDQHYYSVPFEYIGKKLRLQYSRSCVEVFQQYQLIARHKRVRSPHNYTTDPEHMPTQHRFITEWSPSFFLEKAREIDPIVEFYISQVLASKQHPEQGYKSCVGILSFDKRAGRNRLIKACKRAHEIGYYNYKTIEGILKNNLDNYEEEVVPLNMPEHENIRGANYYE